jgi:hypothetical protein
MRLFPFFLLLAPVAAGCGQSAFLLPANAEQRIDGQVDVVARDDAGTALNSRDIVRFTVQNMSASAQMKVDRDAVFLVGPSGSRVSRDPGSSPHTVYDVVPGAVHDVNVRFPLGGFARGDMVAVHFEEAILIGGQPVPIKPLTFQVR